MTENDFRKYLVVRCGARPGYRIWIQNCGSIPVKDERGNTLSYFDAGPPNGAADISGIVIPEGWRIEWELKGPRTKITPAQVNWRKRMEEYGAVTPFYRIDKDHDLEWNLAAAERMLDEAIEDRRRRVARFVNCDCSSCEIVRRAGGAA
jgi:hypothetical protein